MILPPAGVRVLIATRPVDFRRGADGLVIADSNSPYCHFLAIFQGRASILTGSARPPRRRVTARRSWRPDHDPTRG